MNKLIDKLNEILDNDYPTSKYIIEEIIKYIDNSNHYGYHIAKLKQELREEIDTE